MKSTIQKKGKSAVLIALIIILLGSLTTFFINGSDTNILGTSNQNELQDNDDSEEIINLINSSSDVLNQIDGSEVSVITFNGNTIIADDNVEIEGNVAYISSGGSYLISGVSDEGQIIIESEDKEIVNLILDGLELTSSEGSPLIIKEAKETVITIAQGTKNTITDESKYVDPDTDEDATTAAIYSKDDLYVNGLGTLIVNSENKNGIQSKDQLVIVEGDITVNAKKEAIKAKDYVLIEDGKISLTSEEDGISATEDEDTEKGFVVVSGGNIDIDAGQDGIQAETYIIVTGGSLDITTYGGSTNSISDTESAKGIKATNYVQIDGGTINIDSADDAIHSDDIITVNGGSLTISSGDDGIHADSSLTINGGSVMIEKSYEGLESKNIYINDGTIRIYASDDGLNIADSSTNARGGMATVSNAAVTIAGGDIYIECGGDGLDSNGDLYMTGGKVVVNGPIRNDNGGIDVNGKCVVDGGFLVVASSSGMAESPDQTSTQNSVIIGFSSQLPADTIVHIESEDGEEIVTFSPSKTFQAFVLSTDELVTGETYNIFVGGTASGTATDGLYENGDYTGGTLVGEFTITSTKTTVGTTSQMSNMGNMGRQGNRFPGR